jgi:DNA-binding transcriptional LysR family regulator
MELSDLHVFRTVVRAGGINKAAEQLHRVQSSVTVRVRKLEQSLGVALFLREGKRLQLSPAGMVLLDYADRLLELADEARDALHGSEPRGRLRLGTMESTAAARLPGPLIEFHQRYPEVSVEISTSDPQTLMAQVLAGELDAALVAEPVVDGRLETLIAFEEQLVIVADAKHPPIVKADDVTRRTLLAFHPGCPYRKRLEDWFAGHGVLPERVVEMTSFHALLGCAVAGMGVALMPRSVLDTYTEQTRLSIHPLDGEFKSTRILLTWRRNAPQAKVAALAQVLAPQAFAKQTAASPLA